MDDDEVQNGKVVRVKTVVAEDPKRRIFEVLDHFNQTRYIRWLHDDWWIETFLEEE